ncbi:hypothetical protein BDR03DRAFT_873355, partial [Suillus americanus]
ARKEEWKKNKHKYILIQNSGIPDDETITPCSYALCKLEKGEYLELWYFTNGGLDEVTAKKTVDDDAMVLSTLPDGATAWVSSASTRSARSVVNDEDLSFEDFCQACPRFLLALEEADWPQDRLRMMALFWRNLQVHKYRSAWEPLAQKTLLVYQAEQHRHWHVVAKSPAGPYDISVVNEKVLQETKTRVYWEDHTKKDNARDFKVSIHWHATSSSLAHLCSLVLQMYKYISRLLSKTRCSLPHASCHVLHTNTLHTAS